MWTVSIAEFRHSNFAMLAADQHLRSDLPVPPTSCRTALLSKLEVKQTLDAATCRPMGSDKVKARTPKVTAVYSVVKRNGLFRVRWLTEQQAVMCTESINTNEDKC